MALEKTITNPVATTQYHRIVQMNAARNALGQVDQVSYTVARYADAASPQPLEIDSGFAPVPAGVNPLDITVADIYDYLKTNVGGAYEGAEDV